MNRNESLKVVRSAFAAIPEIHCGFREVKETLFDECSAAEKQHRRGRPSPKGFSVADAARYFAVKYLRECALTPERAPTVADYMHLRHELFTAAAIAIEFREKLLPWAQAVRPEFDQVDYVELMS